jgi:hypothetical protein
LRSHKIATRRELQVAGASVWDRIGLSSLYAPRSFVPFEYNTAATAAAVKAIASAMEVVERRARRANVFEVVFIMPSC